jgi:hypothetical protein
MATSIVKIGDLLKVYFLFEKYYFLELVRPLERRDFIVLSPEQQSLRFIKDSDWFYELKSKRRSNFDLYDLMYKAKYEIKFRYEDELRECIKQGLNGKDIATYHADIFYSFFDLYQCSMFIKYDYNDCPTQDSRDTENKRILECLQKRVDSLEGLQKIDKLYTKAIKQLGKKINLLNNKNKGHVFTALNFIVEDNNGTIKEYGGKVYSLSIALNCTRLHILELEKEVELLSFILNKEKDEGKLLLDVNGRYTIMPK